MSLRQRPGTPADYAALLALWERSVVATHDFLEEADRLFYQEQIPQYFEQVSLLLWYDHEGLIGFSGTLAQELEMLFLEPAIGHGYGRNFAVASEPRRYQRVAVNRQNKRAKDFIWPKGFKSSGKV